jgi:hypothetical protein
MVKTLKDSGCDTVCLIPPAHEEKFDITAELMIATKKANVPNVLFISSAGCDVAERDRQPQLRKFIDLECLLMAAKGDGSTSIGHSPCIIRAGFYAEVSPFCPADHLRISLRIASGITLIFGSTLAVTNSL